MERVYLILLLSYILYLSDAQIIRYEVFTNITKANMDDGSLSEEPESEPETRSLAEESISGGIEGEGIAETDSVAEESLSSESTEGESVAEDTDYEIDFARHDKEIKPIADDSTWILTSCFLILTLQTGFAFLERGMVSETSVVNVLMMNTIDITMCGLFYWFFGYGLTYGKGKGTNPLFGVGDFFLEDHSVKMGLRYTTFTINLAIAAVANTIVSGAIAERTNFIAFIPWCFFNTFTYCVCAGWIWGDHGWLRKLGVVDITGCCCVHILGASTALVALLFVGPRKDRYTPKGEVKYQPSSLTEGLIGFYMLWWGFFGFNCSSAYGMSGHKWKFMARAAANTLNTSCFGLSVALIASFLLYGKNYNIPACVIGTLGSLISIGGSCSAVEAYEASIIGTIGSLLTIFGNILIQKLKLDDVVGVLATHGIAGVWGMIASGLFVKADPYLNITDGKNGLLKGGGFYLLGVNMLAVVATIAWSLVMSFIFMWPINKLLGIRSKPEEEETGMDLYWHSIDPYAKDLSFRLPDEPYKPTEKKKFFGHKINVSEATKADEETGSNYEQSNDAAQEDEKNDRNGTTTAHY